MLFMPPVVRLCVFLKPVPVLIERRLAFIAAEIIRFTLVFLHSSGILGVHVHAAYGVLSHWHHRRNVFR